MNEGLREDVHCEKCGYIYYNHPLDYYIEGLSYCGQILSRKEFCTGLVFPLYLWEDWERVYKEGEEEV